MKIVLGLANASIPIWEIIQNSDFMLNHLTINRSLANKLREINSVFMKNGSKLWIDSGGYQIMVKNINISVKDVIKKYREIDAHYYLSLDRPVFEPSKSSKEIIEWNINNYFRISKELEKEGKQVIPIVHLYTVDLLFYAMERYIESGAKIVAYGGVVPPVLRRTRYRLKSLIGLLILKNAFPHIKFHILGIGSYVMIRILREIGVWSLDTSTWRVKAAYGHVIIPGFGERYVGSRNIRFHTPRIRSHELEKLYNVLKQTEFPYIDRFYELLQSFQGRAIINAWVIANADGPISRNSSFYKLYQKIREYNRYTLDELIKLYES